MPAKAAPIAEHAQMGSLLALICFLGAAFGVRLEMFETDGAATALVSPKVNAESGRNVSLFCRLADDDDRYVDTPVVWGRKGKGFRSSKEIIVSPSLRFAPIRLVNQGIYFCASLRYALHKTVYVAVREAEHPKRRLKRQETVGGEQDMNKLYKRTLVLYGSDSSEGQETFSQKFKAYAQVVAPVAVATVIVCIILYCLVKSIRKAIAKNRTSTSCKPSCNCHCKLKGPLGADFNEANCNKSEAPGPSKPNPNEDDTFIILPHLFL